MPLQRAGEYLIIAVAMMAGDISRDPDSKVYERLAKVAERVTLVEGDRRTMELRVVKLPDRNHDE